MENKGWRIRDGYSYRDKYRTLSFRQHAIWFFRDNAPASTQIFRDNAPASTQISRDNAPALSRNNNAIYSI